MVALAPRAPGHARLRGFAATTASVVKTIASRAVRPHRAALATLKDMPLTVLGVAGVDFAAFHISHGWGWLGLGVSLIVVEHVIADEP